MLWVFGANFNAGLLQLKKTNDPKNTKYHTNDDRRKGKPNISFLNQLYS